MLSDKKGKNDLDNINKKMVNLEYIAIDSFRPDIEKINN